ncbi:MAG: MarR family transcriptional regulator [Candidatus Diapherotrites archaeon]|nr:MarR family transcriptional regulator [Candidatus Diapherotrites archaeon]
MRNYVAAALIAVSALATAYATYYAAEAISNGTFCAMDLPIPLYIPIFYALGVGAGLLVQELFRKPASGDVDLDAVARLFDREEEWYIVRELLTKGSVLQSDVSERFGKVRASRAVAALEAKDLIRRERIGKTYVILAGPALRSLLR